MNAIPIHEAKANLSKYIQQAKAGQPVYIGGFGKAEVVLTVIPAPKKNPLWGMYKGMATISDEEWEESDRLIAEEFERSINEDDF